MTNKPFPFKIVFIADRIQTFKDIKMESDDLEFTEDGYFNAVYDSLSQLSNGVVHYNEPNDFLNNISKHSNDLVFSVWSGRKSRNRRALIPSICEAYKIKYIGADTYTNIVCQDKSMSKEFCRKHGLATPRYILYNDFITPEIITNLTLPLVVKPNFEGGSIGISQFNLMDNYDEALKLAKEIFTLFKQDVLIEEFVEGKEISLVFSGNSKGIKISEAVEIVFEDGNGGLSNRLYSFEIKKENDLKIFNKLATDIIPDSVFESAKRIFRLLGKVENLRIDGRFNNGNFSLIELSPDIHYGKGSTFSYAFEKKGYAYEEMMKILIENAIRDV